MKGYFTKAGKYKVGSESVEITDKDVKSQKELEVSEDKAKYFIEAEVFVAGKPKKVEPKPKDFKESEKKKADK